MTKKRFWQTKLFRFPDSAEQWVSQIVHRIPERARFWLNYSFFVLASAFLVAKQALELMPDARYFFGLLMPMAGIYYALYKMSQRGKPVRLPAKTTFWVTGTSIVLQLALIQGGAFIATMLFHNNEMSEFSAFMGFELAIPFSAAALVLCVLVGPQLAFVSSLVVSLFVAMLPEGGIAIAFYSLVGSIAAIFSIERYRTRNSIALGIVIVALTNILMSFCIPMLAHQPSTLRMALNGSVMGVLSALQAAAIASLVMPIYESVFGILTDLKLIELSNTDNELLRELSIRTPGTWHHSMIVGTLAESAAKAIGANSLLARTACLYHDIGKMAAPNMYIENQNGCENPHNRVSARDSVRIITGHVRRGIKMGVEAGLPKQIIDFIPQHHGTRILAYFYHKAKAQAEAVGETVNPEDFRYPGPKPQTKEAVILMLADGAEAAVRSLHDHSEENIRAIIKKIIDHIIADGQFDESDVTLRELNVIRESLISTLRSIYHDRVSYPGFNPGTENEKNAASGTQGTSASVPSVAAIVPNTAPTE